MDHKQIREAVIKSCLKIAREGKGGLVVLGGNPEYELLVNQKIKNVNVLEDFKLFEALVTIDGAMVVDFSGNLIAYGANIIKKGTYFGYGTRHQAAYSASLMGSEAYIISQEDRKVKIFRNGELLEEIDALQKDIEQSIPHALNMMELVPKSLSVGMAGAVGTSLAASIPIGVVLIPGVTVFAGGYLVLQIIKDFIKHSEQPGKQ